MQIPEVQQSEIPRHILSERMFTGALESVQKREQGAEAAIDEELVCEASLDDLDADSVEQLLQRVRDRHPDTFLGGRSKALHRLGILRNGSPTLAALLALGVYPQQFFRRLDIQFGMYPGVDRDAITAGERLLESRSISGSIPEMADRALTVVWQHMRIGAYFDDVQRKELPEYPLPAVREALVNALMHRDYSPRVRGERVRLDMFVDRMEITSPGGFSEALKAEQFDSEVASSGRNQLLSSLLGNIKDCENRLVAENRGTGITVINKALAEALMPPAKIESSFSFFRITFYKRRVAPAERNATAKDYILKRLEKQDSISVKELMQGTKYSRGGIQKALSDLVADNTIEKTEPSRSPKQRYRMKL